MALTKLTKNLIDGTFGTEWVSTIQTSNFTAEAAKGYFVNTTAGTITINLPAGVVGTEIVIQDYAGTFATNKVTVVANGSEKIQGSALGGQITTNNATATLVYQDATKGWTSQDIALDTIDISWGTPTGQGLTYTVPSPQSSSGYTGDAFPTTTFTATTTTSIISGTANFAGLPSGITATQSLNNSNPGNVLTVTLGGVYPSADSLNTVLTISGLTITTPLTVNYLVVAGGGGTSNDGPGGGGAGGLRTSWPGGSGGGGTSETAFTLAVNTNYTVTVGAGGAANTVGSSSRFVDLISDGGGRGSGGGTSYTAGPGGSGGGGAGGSYGNAGGAGTTNQGFAGGGSGPCCGTNYGGGGGGGAGGAGTTPANSGAPSGNGGVGKAVALTGSSIYYAGGGGGSGGNSQGNGGTGGGADGTTGANAGGANLGGGAGGTNATGGSGVVILRYPSAYAISGLSGTTTTVGSDSVTTFTNVGTGNIQFN